MMRWWLIGTLVGLYTAFVGQNLWNWFGASALGLAKISFWQMFGLIMLVQLITEKDEFTNDQRWTLALNTLSSCVPEEKQEEVDEMLKKHVSQMWIQLGSQAGCKVVGNTVVLVVAWFIHTFFV
jgi:hypothetical protein